MQCACVSVQYVCLLVSHSDDGNSQVQQPLIIRPDNPLGQQVPEWLPSAILFWATIAVFRMAATILCVCVCANKAAEVAPSQSDSRYLMLSENAYLSLCVPSLTKHSYKVLKISLH